MIKNHEYLVISKMYAKYPRNDVEPEEDGWDEAEVIATSKRAAKIEAIKQWRKSDFSTNERKTFGARTILNIETDKNPYGLIEEVIDTCCDLEYIAATEE